jgi:ribonuclease-3
MENQAALENIIKYHFANPQLLQEALTAEGASQSSQGPAGNGNKRLALVGDALLRVVILDRWYPCGASTGEYLFSTEKETSVH